jgi:N-hydroxyarylamine O-acetyltransferase
LVAARRGGYCFEHATLLGAALQRLGFEVRPHVGRVTLRVPRTAAPRIHMFLVVRVAEGRFVVDPGFGSWTSRQPLILDDDGVLKPSEGYAMVRDGAWWVLRAPTPEGVIDGWASTLDEDNAMDAEIGNHYTSTHPASTFVNHIMLRAFTAEGKITVMNREASYWRGGDKLRTVTLPDRVALRELLAEHFGFDLPEVESMRVPAIPEWI